MKDDLVLKVRCPRCNYQFTTTTLKLVTCWNCGKRFKVLYYDKARKTFRTRIVNVVRGNINTLYSRIAKVKAECYRLRI